MRSALLRSIASSLRKKLHCWPMLAKAVEGLRGHWSMADVGNLHVRWSRSSVGCWSGRIGLHSLEGRGPAKYIYVNILRDKSIADEG